MPVCAHCNGNAALKCSACSLVYYCSKEHQKLHWKAHKGECTAFKLEENETMGRYMVANRDIKAGSVIMKKLPIVIGPKMFTKPICLGCHRLLQVDHVRCTQCKWPLCHPQCEKSVWHVRECAILANGKLPPPRVDVNQKSSSYAVILPLRAMLLKITNRKRFDELMLLQSHIENNVSKPVYEYLAQTVMPLIKKLNVPEAHDIDPLRICSIFDTNAFEVRNDVVNIRGVYPTVSFLAHDCTSNTRHVCDTDFAMTVIATCDIRKGDLICTTYTQTLWPTLSRRRHLRRVKHFECTCKRCSDPTEMRTFVGSLKCQACVGGLLLSVDPLDDDAHWECTKCKCVVSAFQVDTLNTQIRREILSAPRTIAAFEEMVLNYEHLLHATNAHMLDIKYALVQLYENTHCASHGGSEERLKRCVELCQELLKVSSILEPGCSSFNEALENSMRDAGAALTALHAV